jgi:F-type H+-transporting ATPase subunit a
MDPIHQFEIKNLLPIIRIGGTEIAFTNSALFMLIALALILALMLGATRSRALVPGRLQATAEMVYEFVADTLRSSAGQEGMKFFPLVFSIFVFILVLNVIGIIPYAFTVTSHIIITVAFALLVFLTVVIYGFWRHGLRFLRLFVPSGIPIYILPLVTAIEVMSFFSRPVSHSVRLFANMLAGLGWLGAALPLALTTVLTALELLVALLQAYVFAILTCIYLNDAVHPGH